MQRREGAFAAFLCSDNDRGYQALRAEYLHAAVGIARVNIPRQHGIAAEAIVMGRAGGERGRRSWLMGRRKATGGGGDAEGGRDW